MVVSRGEPRLTGVASRVAGESPGVSDRQARDRGAAAGWAPPGSKRRSNDESTERSVFRCNARLSDRCPRPTAAGDRTTALNLQPAKAEGDDFVQPIDATVAPGASEQITFFLLVERDAATADLGALLTIDSVDVVLGKP
jgi:hypothetical protein